MRKRRYRSLTFSDNTPYTEIPVFFSTDDHYIPCLDVAIASLIDNASKDYAPSWTSDWTD